MRISRKRKKGIKSSFESLFIGVMLHHYPWMPKRNARAALKTLSLRFTTVNGEVKIFYFGHKRYRDRADAELKSNPQLIS